MPPVTPAEAAEAVELEEVVVTPRRAFVPLPDLRVIERPGWLQLITPSLKDGGLNEVAFCALDEGEADAVIDATIAEYRALGIKFRWTVGPDSRPFDLAERLRRRGLNESLTRGMARSTHAPAAAADAPADADVSVEEVDASSLASFTRVMAEGWDIDPGPLARVNELVFAQPERRHRLYLGRVGGEPAAVASYVAFPRSAYLLGGVVLPRFRRRGLYRALVGARLADARARGIALATSHAREETSAPLLEREGFRTVCRFPVFSS
ncbi:MAG TPA: GNAT family N-acetyltransferase [Polyangiaceae bacterium]|nr:GNAT family N-acetyltransferase [Polyangiaceae bacterium]